MKVSELRQIIKEEISKVLNEEKIPFFTYQDVLKPFGIDKPKADQMADLKVGLDYVIPKKHYSDMKDIRQHLGKVKSIEGDKVTIERRDGKDYTNKISDLIHIINFGS